eukprot:4008984-Pleurochrysis_carterae.AAC.1
MARRVPYGDLTYIESRYRIPYASLIQAQEDEVEEQVLPQFYTFSSWNIPFVGPTVDDAMTESLQDDGGFVSGQVSMYFTHNYNDPTTVSDGFLRYEAGISEYNSYNVYIARSGNNSEIPWIGKWAGNEFTHPDNNITLGGVQNGDICTHSPWVNGHGLVVKFKIPIAGVYVLHDSFVMPSRETQRFVAMSISVKTNDDLVTVVPRQAWRGRPVIDQEAFIE